MLKITDERFTLPKDFNLADFMRHSFKIMHDELYTVMEKEGLLRMYQEVAF